MNREKSLRDLFAEKQTQVEGEEDAKGVRAIVAGIGKMVEQMREEGFDAAVDFRIGTYRARSKTDFSVRMNGTLRIDDLEFPFLLKENYKVAGTYRFFMEFSDRNLVVQDCTPQGEDIAALSGAIADAMLEVKAEADALNTFNVSVKKPHAGPEKKPMLARPSKIDRSHGRP